MLPDRIFVRKDRAFPDLSVLFGLALLSSSVQCVYLMSLFLKFNQ